MTDNPPAVPGAQLYPRRGMSVPNGDISKYRQRLGSLLRQRRRSIEPPVSQKDVAEYLCLAQSAVSDWERGESWPSVLSLLVVIRFLGIDPRDIVEILEERPNGDADQAA